MSASAFEPSCPSRSFLPFPRRRSAAASVLIGAVVTAASAQRTGLPTVPPPVWIGITAGANHTCVNSNYGGVACWGADESGQTGTGGNSNGKVTRPTGVAINATQVDAGDAHTCALTPSGAALCWGSNSAGQLGTDVWNRYPVPIAVRGGFTFASISAGGASTCGNTAAGIRCWGKIALQPGDSGGWHVDPTLVAPDGRFFGVSVGDLNACAQFPGPVGVIVRCWGDNRSGQVGVPPSPVPAAPTVVAAIDAGVSRIAAQRDYVCAELGSGIVECLGSNQSGQLGDGSMNSSWTERRVATGTALHGVATGAGFACALDASGRALCWGGGFGPSPRAMPASEFGIDTYRAVAVGAAHACAIGTDNHIYCWGSNSFGQLGVGDQRSDVVNGATIPVRAIDPL